MKKSIFTVLGALVLVLFLAPSAKAQSNNEEIDFFQSIFGMEKKAIVADFLKLPETDGFWAIYDEYETERKELGKQRMQLIKEYAEAYDKMDAAKTDEIIAKTVAQRKAFDKLIDTYYKKIKKSNGSKIAAQFFQIENYFASQIRAAIMESIPFIGDADHK
jgi:hypothetical protein